MSNLLPHALSFLATVTTGASGTWFLTEAAKRLNVLGLSQGATSALRSVAGGLSLISVLLLGLANRDVQPTDLGHIVAALLAFGSTWLGAHSLHKATQPTDQGGA